MTLHFFDKKKQKSGLVCKAFSTDNTVIPQSPNSWKQRGWLSQFLRLKSICDQNL